MYSAWAGPFGVTLAWLSRDLAMNLLTILRVHF